MVLSVSKLKTATHPDYGNHPAYGSLYSAPSFLTRLTALKTWCAAAYKLVPNVKIYSRRKCGGFIKKRMPSWPVPTERQRRLANHFKEEGALAFHMDHAERQNLIQITQPYFQTLEAKRSMVGDGNRKFRDNSLGISSKEAPLAFQAVSEILERCDILAIAREYMGYRVGLCSLVARITGPHDTSYWKNQFNDLKLPDPRTTYMHIDSAFGELRVILYLSEVTTANGPVSFVLGSHRGMGFFEKIVRKANDISELDGRSPESRKLFMALPGLLRRKAAYGADLIDGSMASDVILEHERVFTSDIGDAIFFDSSNGTHRGAMVHSGERRILQVTIA